MSKTTQYHTSGHAKMGVDKNQSIEAAVKGEKDFTPVNLGVANGIDPCPFCLGKEGETVFLGYNEPRYMISCTNCNVRIIDDRKDKVQAKWNLRNGITFWDKQSWLKEHSTPVNEAKEVEGKTITIPKSEVMTPPPSVRIKKYERLLHSAKIAVSDLKEVNEAESILEKAEQHADQVTNGYGTGSNITYSLFKARAKESFLLGYEACANYRATHHIENKDGVKSVIEILKECGYAAELDLVNAVKAYHAQFPQVSNHMLKNVSQIEERAYNRGVADTKVQFTPIEQGKRMVDVDVQSGTPYLQLLEAFTNPMLNELIANDDKGGRAGWLDMNNRYWIDELYYHVGKLQSAVANGSLSLIMEYTADIANISMMCYDCNSPLLNQIKNINKA